MTRQGFGRDGKLRVGFNMNNVALIRKVGEGYAGAAFDLSRMLAEGAGLRLVPIEYPNARAVVDAVGRGWDVAFLALDPERTDRIVFSAPYRSIEATFLVHDETCLLRCSDVLQSGRPILSARGAAYHARLKALVSPDRLVVAATPEEALARFRSGEADALAGIRNFLSDDADPGFTVLSDRFARIEQAVALPRRNGAHLAFVNGIVRGFSTPGPVDTASPTDADQGGDATARYSGLDRKEDGA